MRSLPALLIAFILTTVDAPAATVIIPVVGAPAHPLSSESLGTQQVSWVASRTVSNPTDLPLTFRYVRLFGDQDAHFGQGCLGASMAVPPNYSWRMSLGYLSCVYPGSGPSFLEVDLDPGLILTGGIHLVTFRGCGPPAPLPVSLAAASLPVYETVFPADSTASSIGIPPLERLAPDDPCSYAGDPVARRVNLTVVNTGTEAATAVVRAVGIADPPFIFPLSAGEVVQLNGVFSERDYDILLVTVSEPFLCYASSVTTWSDPSRAPELAVYPFRVLP